MDQITANLVVALFFADRFWLCKYLDLNENLEIQFHWGTNPQSFIFHRQKSEFSQIFLVPHTRTLFAPTHSYASDNGKFSSNIILCRSRLVEEISGFEWKIWKFNFLEKKKFPPTSLYQWRL